VSEFPNYRPDGPWAAVLDAARVIERVGYQHWRRLRGDDWEIITEQFARLAVQFELLPGQRERDLARLFRAAAEIGDGGNDDFDDDHVDDNHVDEVEDKPLSGD
jgi:hypothetical protein